MVFGLAWNSLDPRSAFAAEAKAEVLAEEGIWRLVRTKGDPFGDQKAACEIQTALPGGDTGRREQGRVRVSVSPPRMVIDPPVMQTQAVRLRRRLVDRRDALDVERRTDVANELTHRLRVDDGAIHEFVDRKVGFSSWVVHETDASFDDLFRDLANGKQLHYQWSLDPASSTFSYDLSGFARLRSMALDRC